MFPNFYKLENLYKVQQAKLYVHAEAIGQGRTTCNIVEKVGNIVTIIFDSGNALRNINDNTVIFSIPEGYRPKVYLAKYTALIYSAVDVLVPRHTTLPFVSMCAAPPFTELAIPTLTGVKNFGRNFSGMLKSTSP